MLNGEVTGKKGSERKVFRAINQAPTWALMQGQTACLWERKLQMYLFDVPCNSVYD